MAFSEILGWNVYGSRSPEVVTPLKDDLAMGPDTMTWPFHLLVFVTLLFDYKGY